MYARLPSRREPDQPSTTTPLTAGRGRGRGRGRSRGFGPGRSPGLNAGFRGGTGSGPSTSRPSGPASGRGRGRGKRGGFVGGEILQGKRNRGAQKSYVVDSDSDEDGSGVNRRDDGGDDAEGQEDDGGIDDTDDDVEMPPVSDEDAEGDPDDVINLDADGDDDDDIPILRAPPYAASTRKAQALSAPKIKLSTSISSVVPTKITIRPSKSTAPNLLPIVSKSLLKKEYDAGGNVEDDEDDEEEGDVDDDDDEEEEEEEDEEEDEPEEEEEEEDEIEEIEDDDSDGEEEEGDDEEEQDDADVDGEVEGQLKQRTTKSDVASPLLSDDDVAGEEDDYNDTARSRHKVKDAVKIVNKGESRTAKRQKIVEGAVDKHPVENSSTGTDADAGGDSDDGEIWAPDANKMTKRQRGIHDLAPQHHMKLSDEVQAKKQFTAEELSVRKLEMARRRRNFTSKRDEEVKMETINKLLKKQPTRGKGRVAAFSAALKSGAIVGQGQGDGQLAVARKPPDAVFVRWVSSKAGIRVSVPVEMVNNNAFIGFGPVAHA